MPVGGISIKEITRFIRWANRTRKRRGLICHFYIAKSTKQYYSTTDYAYFNLFAETRDWIVKGTPHHGIRSQRGKRSPVPCLNCFEIDDQFHDALKTLLEEGNEKFEFGLILNKRKLKNWFGKKKIVDVSKNPPIPRPPPKQCHLYDWPRKRVVLYPFHYCDVVRVEIPQFGFFNLAITSIPYHTVMGILTKLEDYSDIRDLLEEKRWETIEVFPLL